MLKNVIRHVEKLLNENRAWPYSVQPVANRYFEFRVTWLCGNIQHGGLKIMLCSKHYGMVGLPLGGDCASCVKGGDP